MNRIPSFGLAAVLAAGSAFGQADKSKSPDPQSKEDTSFQKGHKDPSELPKQKKDQKKTGKAQKKADDKAGKTTKADPPHPITDPHEAPVPYGPNAPTIKR